MLAKENKWREIASDLDNSENENSIFQIARKMVKERQDVTGFRCLKNARSKVVVDENGTKDTWKKYMENLMKKLNGIMRSLLV